MFFIYVFLLVCVCGWLFGFCCVRCERWYVFFECMRIVELCHWQYMNISIRYWGYFLLFRSMIIIVIIAYSKYIRRAENCLDILISSFELDIFACNHWIYICFFWSCLDELIIIFSINNFNIIYLYILRIRGL